MSVLKLASIVYELYREACIVIKQGFHSLNGGAGIDKQRDPITGVVPQDQWWSYKGCCSRKRNVGFRALLEQKELLHEWDNTCLVKDFDLKAADSVTP